MCFELEPLVCPIFALPLRMGEESRHAILDALRREADAARARASELEGTVATLRGELEDAQQLIASIGTEDTVILTRAELEDMVDISLSAAGCRDPGVRAALLCTIISEPSSSSEMMKQEPPFPMIPEDDAESCDLDSCEPMSMAPSVAPSVAPSSVLGTSDVSSELDDFMSVAAESCFDDDEASADAYYYSSSSFSPTTTTTKSKTPLRVYNNPSAEYYDHDGHDGFCVSSVGAPSVATSEEGDRSSVGRCKLDPGLKAPGFKF